jgi:two-component system alkaline phosphatase synthesis response regulator PhoP
MSGQLTGLRLLVLDRESQAQAELCADLTRDGVACKIVASDKDLAAEMARQSPDAVLVAINDRLPDSGIWQSIRSLKPDKNLPVIALVPREILLDINGDFDADDFVVTPCDSIELVLRINRLLHKNSMVDNAEQIKRVGLEVDISRCEVSVDGRIVELTFKEYELLKLLAGNKGRVYTREVLLDKIWGYDYYGGDRTVDVHVRRLRSKIEDPKHSYIETVRNMGYRFKKDVAVDFVT